MALHDISVTITNDLPTWPGDPTVNLQRNIAIAKGDPCNVTHIDMGAHTGTHCDAPFHFLDDGETIDHVPLDRFIGRCIVLELDVKKSIEKQDLEKHDFKGHQRVLLKTANSKLWADNHKTFNKEFIAVGLSGAEYLVEKGVDLVGVDYLSVESFYAEFEHPVHKTLLSKEVIVVEGLNLSGIKPGEYELICMPLKLGGADGTPVRAALRDF